MQQKLQKRMRGKGTKDNDEGEGMRLQTFLEHLGRLLQRFHDQKINTNEVHDIFSEDLRTQVIKRAPKNFIPMLDRTQGQLTQARKDILESQERT